MLFVLTNILTFFHRVDSVRIKVPAATVVSSRRTDDLVGDHPAWLCRTVIDRTVLIIAVGVFAINARVLDIGPFRVAMTTAAIQVGRTEPDRCFK
jgi:hypothetical protein